MNQISTKYLGELRTEAVHSSSGNRLITDAPVDNNGKGEAFSPTDLLCTSLSTCMMTLMGIYAKKEGLDITGMTSKVWKIMGSNPRKVKEVKIHFECPNLIADEVQQNQLKQAALGCPVALSLSDELKQSVSFSF